MIHAYAEEYVDTAQRILGDAFDAALVSRGLDPDLFTGLLLASRTMEQFSRGNPAFAAGVNGCELVRMMLDESGLEYEDLPDELYLDKSAEYWAGWALAYYQWYSGRTFEEILHAVTLEELIGLYGVYHEMDVSQFADDMEQRIREARTETRLRFYRDILGLSQSELAARAEVPIRQIQLFEQRQRDINKTQAATLLRLSRALYCKPEDLLER